MDTSIITEVGIGGAVAIIIIREVLNFVKEKKNNNSNSNFVPRKECEQIVKRVDAAFEAQEKMFKIMEKRIEQHFREVKKLILNGGK
jgi:hypothetical protein